VHSLVRCLEAEMNVCQKSNIPMVLVRRAADITPVFSGLTLQVVGKQSGLVLPDLAIGAMD
ncbi:MAG: hypothetical protein ACK50M_07985, partial [Cyclobacteriaceae bacterium]